MVGYRNAYINIGILRRTYSAHVSGIGLRIFPGMDRITLAFRLEFGRNRHHLRFC